MEVGHPHCALGIKVLPRRYDLGADTLPPGNGSKEGSGRVLMLFSLKTISESPRVVWRAVVVTCKYRELCSNGAAEGSSSLAICISIYTVLCLLIDRKSTRLNSSHVD